MYFDYCFSCYGSLSLRSCLRTSRSMKPMQNISKDSVSMWTYDDWIWNLSLYFSLSLSLSLSLSPGCYIHPPHTHSGNHTLRSRSRFLHNKDASVNTDQSGCGGGVGGSPFLNPTGTAGYAPRRARVVSYRWYANFENDRVDFIYLLSSLSLSLSFSLSLSYTHTHTHTHSLSLMQLFGSN